MVLQPFERQGLIIRPSAMLSNQGHITPCAKLSGLLNMNLRLQFRYKRLLPTSVAF